MDGVVICGITGVFACSCRFSIGWIWDNHKTNREEDRVKDSEGVMRWRCGKSKINIDGTQMSLHKKRVLRGRVLSKKESS